MPNGRARGQIWIAQDCPLDPSYQSTLFFSSQEEQLAYFKTLDCYVCEQYTFVKNTTGTIRVEYDYPHMQRRNYIFWQNGSFDSNTWFYAFVTNVTYINENCTEIEYMEDSIQSYMFSWTMNPVFVEREHVEDDNPGNYLLAEPVQLSEYVYNELGRVGATTAGLYINAVVVLVNDVNQYNEQGELVKTPVNGSVYQHVYSGSTVHIFWRTDGFETSLAYEVNQFLEDYTIKPESIGGIYMVPLGCFAGWEGLFEPPGGHMVIPGDQQGANDLIYLASNNAKMGDYTPRNKKLLTYPYFFLNVDNNAGDNCNLRYEYFNDRPYVRLQASFMGNPQVSIFPVGYKNLYGHWNGHEGEQSPGVKPIDEAHNPLYAVQNAIERVTIEKFPLCSWAYDSYAAYQAQNATGFYYKNFGKIVGPILQQVAKSDNLMTGFGSALQKGITMAGKKLFSKVTSSDIGQRVLDYFGLSWNDPHTEAFDLAEYTAANQVDIAGGSYDIGGLNNAHKVNGFYYRQCYVNEECAAYIDSFFDLYGYRVDRIKVPNISARPVWNFVKTKNMQIYGRVPMESKKVICSAFNNGITWWRNPATMGRYDLDNSMPQ